VTGENGAPLEWIGAQLGHSSIKITRDTHGHWSRDEEKKMAASLDGAFTV
jgi:integrase